MKKISYIIILIIIISNTYITFWNYQTINNNISIETQRTSILLKKYIINLNKKIIFFKNKLDLNNDSKINWWINDLKKISNAINIIQNNKISKLKANILLKAIINKLKSINNEVKEYFKEKTTENQKKIKDIKYKYNNIINNFVSRLIQAIKKVKNNLDHKQNITAKDKEIIFHLSKLKKYIINLSYFSKKEFFNVKELKLYLINNLKGIIYQINKIKEII